MFKRAIHRIVAPALVALIAAGGVATPAVAAPGDGPTRNGSCEKSEFCYFYNSGTAGSVSDFPGKLRTLANYGDDPATCYVFRGSGNGKDECIKNNAASVWNRTDRTVRVYYNSGHAGKYQNIEPGFRGNLSAALKNNNASHRIRPAAQPENPTPPNNATPPAGRDAKIAKAIKAARAEISAHPLYAWGGGHGARPGATRGNCSGGNGLLNGVCVAENRIGFDCSGLMRLAFFKATGYDMGGGATYHHYAKRPAIFGSTITSISKLRPGDMVLIKYGTGDKPVNHTGIVSKVNGSKITIVEAANTRKNLREATMVNSAFRKAYRLK